ncbi:MAG: type II toxin-antitoxin system VapC family toxin [Cellulomonas sp.]|jgi:predicted nucleic acid-binding protein|nr:type II toxin-antitoxin system VapC family toxin [Cellulomonas sp.]
MPGETTQGLLDTNILVLRAGIAPGDLPDQMAISAVTLAELTAGVHLVSGDDPEASGERARRVTVLQKTENEFDPIGFDADAARAFGQVCAAVAAAGRTPRIADLMIAATAAVHGLPLYTTNPDDFAGLETLITVVPVPRPTAM